MQAVGATAPMHVPLCAVIYLVLKDPKVSESTVGAPVGVSTAEQRLSSTSGSFTNTDNAAHQRDE